MLNEHTIKNGYFDKSTTPQAESVSARPAIWSNVKHNRGLQLLSSLYITTLQQRQTFGAVSAASTFKPPPRATLTEPKREIWLRDLADADIPLRRLSRTIPHGIRGKTLLDHCVAKQIPFDRAIWLVKCVGANEIRAFKRKGPNALVAGSENKWVLEWTTSVEEFLNALIEVCGSSEWKDTMNYGLQLVAHIYAESLVDKSHFLEWIISSLQAASSHKLPIWILITQMYWNEMPSYRKFGKNLAVALCEQAAQLYGQVVEATQFLWDKLSELILKLIIQQPACFVFPSQWSNYAIVMEAICNTNEELYDKVRQQNKDLAAFACNSSISDSRQQILEILDKNSVTFDVKRMSRRLLDICPDMGLLTKTICQWATTIYRPSFESMYLCLRLLRRWSRSRFDLELSTFSFIRSCSDRPDLDRRKLFRIVSELIRSKHISITRYLQWIMAQGTPFSLEKELLLCAPLYGLPDHVRNLCQMILNHPLPQESKLTNIQSAIRDRLFQDAMVDEELDYGLISALSLGEQYRLSHWIRNLLFDHVDDDNPLTSADDFMAICRLLEALDDYAILADVLGVYAETGATELLLLVSDTLNKHFDCLHTIGATESICETILQRMEEVPNRSPAQKPLIQSLVDLVLRLSRRSKTLLVLQKELILCEPKSAVAACSPVSDSMGETQEDITFFEEVEILFGSGTSMDRPLLTRLFTDIVKRLETSWTDDIFTSINLAEFLIRLKSFNREIFSTLMPTWIGTILTGRQDIKTLLAILICGGLLATQELYTRLVTQVVDTMAMSTAIIVELLDLLLEIPTLPRSYHIRTEVKLMIENDALTLARFISIALDKAGESILSKPGLRELVLKLSTDEPALQEFFPNLKPTLLADLALSLPKEPHFIQQLPNVLCYFNSALCAGKLRKMLNEDAKVELTGVPVAILREMRRAMDCKIEPWSLIIRTLPRPAVLEVHTLLGSALLDGTFDSTHESGEALLSLIALVVHNLDPQDLVGTIALYSDRLSKLQVHLSQATSTTEPSIAEARSRLELVLRLISIHADVFSQAQPPTTIHLTVCLNLSSLFTNPIMNFDNKLRVSVLNTITLLSNAMSNEVRDQLIHTLNTHNITNTTLQFLFGPTTQNIKDADLHLITTPAIDVNQQNKDKPTPINRTTATGVPSVSGAKDTHATPFSLHRWEMIQDATPMIGDNDTSLSLALFGARKAVL